VQKICPSNQHYSSDACSIGFAQQVQTDYDKKANFSQDRTCEWNKGKTSNPLWKQRTTDAVDRDLQAKRLQRVQSGGGDLALMAVGATRDQQY
jgi:hypothetical protein